MLWYFAVICALLDFTCGGLLDGGDCLVDNLFIPLFHGPPKDFFFSFSHFLCNYRVKYGFTCLFFFFWQYRSSAWLTNGSAACPAGWPSESEKDHI